jgi:hypothetical protein
VLYLRSPNITVGAYCVRVTSELTGPLQDASLQTLLIEQLERSLVSLTLQCSLRDLMVRLLLLVCPPLMMRSQLSKMGSQLGNLHIFQLYQCPFITLHGFEKLCANTVSLQTLAVQECRQIKLDTVQLRVLTKKVKTILEKTTVERKL